MGHYLFGFNAAGCYIGLQTGTGKFMALLGMLGVCASIAVASKRVLELTPLRLAYASRKTVLWAWITRSFYFSSLFFWPCAVLAVLFRPS